MEFIFFDDKDKILFVRSDAESANWTVEELSLAAEFPYDEFREIQRGQRIAFEDDTGTLQPFEIRKVESMEPDHYQRITAEHIAVSELTDEHCQAVALTDTTAQTALEGLLAGSLWRVGNVTAAGTSSADIATGSVWQAVRAIETNWNVYITPRVTFDSTGITGRFLDIAPAEGVWRGVRLSIDKNADEIGVTYDDTNVITAMYGYGRSIAEAARTLWPVNFSIINPGHVMIVSGSAITVQAAQDWDIYRYAFPQRTTFSLQELLKNAAVDNVAVAAYELNQTYYPIDPENTGDVITADAIAINCRKNTIIDAGTPVTYAPSQFTIRYAGHAFMGNEHGIPTVVEAPGWDMLYIPLDQPTTLRLDALQSNNLGVYDMFYEMGGTYYPLGADNPGVIFTAEELLINRHTTTTTETDAQRTITPPTGFTRLRDNEAFMGNDAGEPTFVSADGWEVWRLPLTAGQTIRLDSMAANDALGGVYPMGYESGGEYLPLWPDDATGEFQADALLVNAHRRTEMTGGTWTDYNKTSAFTDNVFNGGAVMQNGAQVYVQIAPDWNIMRCDLGGRQRIKIKSFTANPNTAGTVVVALERDSTYYPINLEDLTTEYEADALVINRRKMTVSSWGSYTYSYTGFSRYRDDTALMNDGSGGVYYQPAENWRVYRRAFDKRTRIKCTSITQNSSLSGVTVAAYEVGGNLYTLSASSTTEIECDAILINCHVGGFPVTLTPPDGFSDYTVDHNQVMEINPNGQSVYTPNTAWNTPRYELGKWSDIRIDSVIYNEQVQGVYAIGCWTGDLHVIRQEEIDAKTVFNASSIKVNYLKTTAQYAATQITYTPNPNTLYFSATSISIQAYETSDIYVNSATSLVISQLDGATPTIVRDYSATQAVISPNIRHITSYAYSMSTATLTPVTVTETHDYSMDHMTYVPTAGATGSASQTFANVVWSTANGDPANKPEGQTYVIDETATAIYGRNGRPRWGYYQNGNVSDPETLLTLTWRSLQQTNKPRVSIDMLVHDLYRLGYADQPIKLHDIALVEIQPIGVELMLEIVRLSVDLLDPTGTRPTIGTYIPNIVYINRETAVRASGGGRGGGGNGRGQTAAQKELSEFETEISANNYQISLRAYQRDMDNVSDILRQAGLSIDANGVLVYAEDNANMWASRLKVESDRISLVVTGTGENAHVNPASIITAINNNKSSVHINADQIMLNGDVSIAGLLTGQTRASSFKANLLQANTFNYKGYNASWRQMTLLDSNNTPVTVTFMVRQN